MKADSDRIMFRSKKQNLVNIALKRDPNLPRSKPVVSFVDDLPPTSDNTREATTTATLVNESPPFNSNIDIAPSQLLTVDKFPPVNATIKPTSARSISSVSPILYVNYSKIRLLTSRLLIF